MNSSAQNTYFIKFTKFFWQFSKFSLEKIIVIQIWNTKPMRETEQKRKRKLLFIQSFPNLDSKSKLPQLSVIMDYSI